MRKFFALALAVAMVLSLASVAFAAEATNKYAAVKLEGPYRYDSDDNVMIAPGEDKDVLRYGEGTYYLIKILDSENKITDATVAGSMPIQTYKEVEKLKVKADFEMGKDLVESVSIVKKYIDKANQNTKNCTQVLTDGVSANGYYYFVELKVVKKETVSEADIIATLEFNRKADDDVKSSSNDAVKGIGKIDDCEQDINFTVFYKNTWVNTLNRKELKVTDDVVDIKWDTDYALKFDCDEEVEFEFGPGSSKSGNNEGTFTVDVSGQGKVYLRYNTKVDEAIAAANPGVKMYFLNFNNAKFNRTGEFVYEMDDIAAAYKVVDGQLVEIKGLELDADSATFHTRVLESYVFADAELVNPAPAAAEVEAPAAEVTNPTTGAAA